MDDWQAATAAYFALRGLPIKEFLKASKFEQLFYHAAKEIEEERRLKELNSILKSIAKMVGAKVRETR